MPVRLRRSSRGRSPGLRHVSLSDEPRLCHARGQEEIESLRPTSWKATAAVWDLEIQLVGAIERGEMSLQYLPQVRASDRRFIGAEALMRWTGPSRGSVSPNVIIPIAERTGHIRPLTAWALNTALRQAQEWLDEERITVSVNLPGSLAVQPDLPELVEAALKLWGRDRVQLVLEVTEGSLMDAERAFASLVQPSVLAVRSSIDDFGTGDSCLAYFKSISADELKIDKSFVRELLTDRAHAGIVRLVVDLCQRLGLSVAAEGDDDATLEALRAIGCDIVQGFGVGRPMASAQLRKWVIRHLATGAVA